MARTKRKLALVMSGGSMRCVYGAGVITALVEKYGETEPDIMVASSGSVMNGAYHLAGQYRSAIAVWLDVAPSSNFISFGRRKIIDLDSVVDELEQHYPLDLKTFAQRKTKFVVAATRVRDGKTIFLSMPRTKDIYARMRASAAVPVIYGKDVPVGKESYVDGDIGSKIQDLIAEAIRLGADDIIVVDNGLSNAHAQALWQFTFKALVAEERLRGRTGVLAACDREVAPRTLTIPPRVHIVKFTAPPEIMPFTRNKRELRKAFDKGYDEVMQDTELLHLFASRI